MNENVGASFGLSVLIVVFFAVVLYQPDRPPPSLAAGHPTSAPITPDPPAAAAPVPVVLTEPPPPAPKPIAPAATPPTVVAARRDTPTNPVVTRPVSRRSVVETEFHPAREPFVVVLDGETLADVAVRVYGNRRGVDPLWRANRDVLDGPTSPLRPGTRLRTL